MLLFGAIEANSAGIGLMEVQLLLLMLLSEEGAVLWTAIKRGGHHLLMVLLLSRQGAIVEVNTHTVVSVAVVT